MSPGPASLPDRCSLHPVGCPRLRCTGIHPGRDGEEDGGAGTRLSTGRCSGAFGLPLAADDAFHGPHLPSAFSLCALNRAALETEKRIPVSALPSEQGNREGGAARLLSCLMGAKTIGTPRVLCCWLQGVTLIHRPGTLSWTSKELASKINKKPHQHFHPSLSNSCWPHASEQKKDFH